MYNSVFFFLLALIIISCMPGHFLEIYPYVTVEGEPSDSSKYFFIDSSIHKTVNCTTIAQASGRVLDIDNAFIEVLKKTKTMGGNAFIIVDPSRDIVVRKTFLIKMPKKGQKIGLKESYFFRGLIVKFLPDSLNSGLTDSTSKRNY